ncbi:MAG: SAF domain-containing protein [Coriobacteriales bacterium]|nr:SAF domain-containing protein [Coriobacteriales bacterium]
MNKRKRMLISLGCALLSVLICLLYARQVEGEAERTRTEALERYGGEVVSLVVANRTLEAGETVSTRDVELRDWVASLAPKDAQTKLEEVVGKEISEPVAEGAPLTALNFREASELAEIPPGHVAVAIPVTDKLGVSSAIPVGSHVIAYRTDCDGTQLIAGDATILSSPGAAGSSAGRSTISVAVGSDDVSSVLAASTEGSLRLVIPADDVRGTTETPRSKDVMPVQDPGATAQTSQTESAS